MFNPEDFMNSAADPLATQFETCPEGEFPFIIDSDPAQLIPKELSGTSKKTGNAYHFWQLELNCICQSDEVRQKVGRDKVVVRLRLNLDLDDNGRLEVGPNKNVGLGQLRDALGQNTPGWTPKNLLGAGPFIGKVTQTKTDKGGVFADISRVGKVV